MNQSWSIIVFGYNEGKTIPQLIFKVNDFLIKNDIGDNEIIMVDDGSTDNSESIIRDLMNKIKNLKYIRHLENFGIGPALLSGYNNAKKENVVAIPADGQFDIYEMSQFINFPEKSFISFYRHEIIEYSFYRKIVTLLNRQFNKYLLNLEIEDVNWVKAFKTKDIKEIDLKLTSSLVCTEICSKLNSKGYKAIDALSVYHKRVSGKARGASIKTLSQATRDILKLYLIIKEFKKHK